LDSFKVNRDLPVGRYKLRDVFSGFEDVEALKKCIGNPDLLNSMIDDIHVSLTHDSEYMYINDQDGSIVIGLEYLKSGDAHYLYLDLIHELVHVKQFL
jgi:glutaredoxin-related protein